MSEEERDREKKGCPVGFFCKLLGKDHPDMCVDYSIDSSRCFLDKEKTNLNKNLEKDKLIKYQEVELKKEFEGDLDYTFDIKDQDIFESKENLDYEEFDEEFFESENVINDIFLIQKENMSFSEEEIKFFKNQKREFIKSRLTEIANKQELTVKNFFHLVKIGVEDILGVKINYRELSIDYLKMKNKWYVNDRILESLRFTDGYALSTASLNQFERGLVKAFQEKSAYFKYLIKLYKSINPWSHKFSKQPSIITDYFKNIDTLEKAYWFGFLLAEGYIRIKGKSNSFYLGLGALDLNHLIRFCKIIGFDYKKLKYRRTVGKNGQTLSIYLCLFANKEFCDNLIKSGFPEIGKTSDNPDLRFPYWNFSDKRFAMAMLLGLFDGDGSHAVKFPNKFKENERRMFPIISSKSKQCLKDIKYCFNIKNKIVDKKDDTFSLVFDKELFNNLLLNFDKSLERKQHIYKENDLPNRWEISKILLGKGWSLEEIYTREFGYSYRFKECRAYKKNLIDHFKEWFANDPAVKDSNDIVSLRKICEVYGKLENNPLVYQMQIDRVILRRREGWSLEKIYIEELGYSYNPSDASSCFRMRHKFKEIFKDDPLIIGHEDILKRIEEVYNPVNKL